MLNHHPTKIPVAGLPAQDCKWGAAQEEVVRYVRFAVRSELVIPPNRRGLDPEQHVHGEGDRHDGLLAGLEA